MRENADRLFRWPLAVLLLGPTTAFACTCTDPGRDTEDKVIDAMCAVDVVFVGETVALTTMPHGDRQVKVAPLSVYKGNVPVQVVLETATTCDHWFQLNQT